MENLLNVTRGKVLPKIQSLGDMSMIKVCNPYSSFTRSDREGMAQSWHFQLIASDCMVADYLFKYVHELKKMMCESGLARFKNKKYLSDMEAAVSILQRTVTEHGRIQIKVFCTPLYAPLVQDFQEDGGDMVGNIVLALVKYMNDYVNRILAGTTLLVRRTRCPNSQVIIHLQMIMLFVETSMELFETVRQRVSGLLMEDDVDMKNVYKYYGTIKKAAMELILAFYNEDKYPMNAEDANDIRLQTYKFQEKLVGDGVRKEIDDIVWKVRADYMIYVILRLGMKVRNGGLDRKDLKHLMVRLGNRENVLALIKELGKIKIIEKSDMDIQDMMQEYDLPKKKGTMLETFFRASLEDKVMYKMDESTEDRSNRNLRKLVYNAFDGCISAKRLEYWFYLYGTKKSVEKMLLEADGGSGVMKRTLKRFAGMKVADMRKPDARYFFDFGAGIETVMKEKGITHEELRGMLGIDRQNYADLLKANSLKYGIKYHAIKKLLYDLIRILKVDRTYFLYLTVKETDDENVAVCSFNHVFMRGCRVYLGIVPEENKEKGN